MEEYNLDGHGPYNLPVTKIDVEATLTGYAGVLPMLFRLSFH
jgi:hypothetical protein